MFALTRQNVDVIILHLQIEWPLLNLISSTDNYFTNANIFFSDKFKVLYD